MRVVFLLYMVFSIRTLLFSLFKTLLQKIKEKVDELVEIILDVVCSRSDTIRVNGEEVPHEVVKSRFLIWTAAISAMF